MSRIMQNLILPKLQSDQVYCEEFYSNNSLEPDYSLPLRNIIMRRTFHLDCPNGKLNISESVDGSEIKLSINDTEVSLDFESFNELCSLKYTLNLNPRVF